MTYIKRVVQLTEWSFNGDASSSCFGEDTCF